MKYIEIVEFLSKIDKIYEEVFNGEGLDIFTQLIWLNIKEDFDDTPAQSDIVFKVMIEKILIYAIIIDNKNGYDILVKDMIRRDIGLKFRTYEKMQFYYGEYIRKVQKFFQEHPDTEKDTIKDQ